MPTKDAEKRRETNRKAQARRRAGVTGKRASPPAASPPDVTPKQSPLVDQDAADAVRCWHCGAYHATVQLARDCKLETEEGRVCATYGMSATARRPDRKTLVDVAAIAKSLSAGKLGHLVRFGCFGPTFEEIAKVLRVQGG